MGFVFLGLPGVSDGSLSEVFDNPGAHAWVRLERPVLTEKTLQMAVLDIRTKWISHDRPEGLDVFRQAAKPFRALLNRPVWCWSVGGDGRVTQPNVGFSEGARQAFADGVEWVQAGVANVRFGPQQPSD